MSDEAKRIVAEETWVADGSFVIDMHVDEHGHDAGMVADMGTQVAATIAACAPEALRMLQKLEWCRGDGWEECPFCRRSPEEGHKTDCEFTTLMRKAGLRD